MDFAQNQVWSVKGVDEGGKGFGKIDSKYEGVITGKVTYKQFIKLFLPSVENPFILFQIPDII